MRLLNLRIVEIFLGVDIVDAFEQDAPDGDPRDGVRLLVPACWCPIPLLRAACRVGADSNPTLDPPSTKGGSRAGHPADKLRRRPLASWWHDTIERSFRKYLSPGNHLLIPGS